MLRFASPASPARELSCSQDALEEEREKLALIEDEKRLNEMKQGLDFGPDVQSLPVLSWEEFKATGKGSKIA